MRRAILAVLVTAVGLMLLLSFKPREITASADRPAALSQSGGDQRGGARDSVNSNGNTIVPRGDEDDDDDDDDARGTEPGTRVPANPGDQTGQGTNAGATSGEKEVTGDAADTRWGPVQVAVVVSGGKITGIKVLQAPDTNRKDIIINNRALPILNQAALTAQSAQIDTVSGATYTSEGYVRSLQSALDKAGL